MVIKVTFFYRRLIWKTFPIQLHAYHTEKWLYYTEAYKMKRQVVIILFVFFNTTAFAQKINLNQLTFNNLGFCIPKEVILKTYGDPKVTFPNNECGFFSSDRPNEYYQLQYPNFTYIGSDSSKFFLERVDFDESGSIKLYYNDKILSGLTTKSEFALLFGETEKSLFEKYNDKDRIVIMSPGDDGARFTFKNGRLIRFEYWTPC